MADEAEVGGKARRAAEVEAEVECGAEVGAEAVRESSGTCDGAELTRGRAGGLVEGKGMD